MRTSTWRRIVARLTRNRLDDEIQEEIRDHLERRREQLIAEGVDPAEAAATARRGFGNVASVRDRMHDGWGFPRLDSLLQDVRYGARILGRAPAFTAVAVLSLSLGVGAAAAVFNVADAVLFRPLSVRDPGTLRAFQATISFGGGARKEVFGADHDAIAAMRKAADFADLIGFRTIDDVALTIAGDARMVRAELVSPDYFAVLGVPAAAGRILDPGDRGPSPVPVVISERLWRGGLAADPSVIGRSAVLNNAPVVIIGIARDFRGLMAERPADVFAPLDATAVVEPTAAATLARVVMRVHPEVSTAAAEQKMAAVYQQLGPPMARAGELRVTLRDVSRGASDTRDDLRRPIVLGLLLVAVLMVIACANTGGLLVARFAARRTEFGIRIAIGAGHGRLMRQLIVEALLLAILAGAGSLLIAYLAGPALAAAMPAGTAPVDFEVRFDWRLVLFTALASVAASAGAGVVSLRQLMRTDTASVLSVGSRSLAQGRRRSMEVLVASQIGCSLLLLVVTGAMGRTLVNLRHVDPGFDPAGAVAITVDANARTMPPEQLPAYFSALYDRIAGMPQVQQVTLSQMGLLTRGMTTGTLDIPGRSAASEEERSVRLFFVGAGFFETAGMRMVAGSGIGTREMTGSERVAVVTQRFADVHFGGAHDALGRLVNRDLRIIGVVADGRYNTFRDAPVRAMFLPFTQAPSRPVMTFIVRGAGDDGQTISDVSAVIRSYDPVLKVTATPMAKLVDAAMGRERFAAWVAAGLALLALVLSCAGVYATVAFAVAERRTELAVRLALGATPRDVRQIVIGGPLRLALVGICLGVPCAYALMRAISTLLFGVSPSDASTILGSSATLLLVTAAAAALPAWRASRIDPHECLKAQ
jgi:predicted permease